MKSKFRKQLATRGSLSVCVFLIALTFGKSLFAQTQPDLSAIRLPAGFSIEIWSDDVANARSLALGDNGTVFVSTRRDGRVYALVPRDGAKPRPERTPMKRLTKPGVPDFAMALRGETR